MNCFSFYDKFDMLCENELILKITEKHDGDEIMLPFYYYDIWVDGRAVGKISIRIGSNYHSYYNGNIGYEIDEEYRGNHYAFKACKLVLQVARAHGMRELILTCDASNMASRKTIEKLGAKLIETIKPPEDYFAYYDEIEEKRIYRLGID
ncbi:MAG: GNAT family N-acetyltransferase [Lachnospiraceae bacterium]|nr:GNAT family N-acetyltransferase [Lachnospiraceae bacterium]